MLVEFSSLLDKDQVAPTASNMTVEAMPNDNLVSTDYRHQQRNLYLLYISASKWRGDVYLEF